MKTALIVLLLIADLCLAWCNFQDDELLAASNRRVDEAIEIGKHSQKIINTYMELIAQKQSALSKCETTLHAYEKGELR